MGRAIQRLPHSCGTQEGLVVFQEQDESVHAWCYSCKTKVDLETLGLDLKNLPKPKPSKTPEEIREELEDIKNLPSANLMDRKLSKATLDYFGVRIGYKPDILEVGFHFYPYKDKNDEIIAYKVRRVVDKKMWTVGSFKGIVPFGWHEAIKAGDRTLYITEGEIDCMSLFAVIKKERSKSPTWKDQLPSVISIPSGASSAVACIKDNLDVIRSFRTIVICFDNDEAGIKAQKEVLGILPNAIPVTLPLKDVNEMLVQGNHKKLLELLVFNKQASKTSRLVAVETLFEKAKEPPQYGLPYPFEAWTKLTRGMRWGETTYIGAAQKMGKSELVNVILAHYIKMGIKCLAIKPEEANVKTVKMVASKMVGKFFHDPSKPFDPEAFDEACKEMRGKLQLVDLYQKVNWENIQADIREAVADGFKIVIIDPLTNFTNHLNAAEANTRLQEIAQTLAEMAKTLDIHIFIFCHLRNKESGKQHERGGEVLTSEFAGSRAMGRSCNYMLGLEGNKSPNLSEEERNIRNLVLLDDREFGETGTISLSWNSNTGLFEELPNFVNIRNLGEE